MCIRPSRQWTCQGLRPVRSTAATQTLTRKFFEREYLQAGKTLRELEAEAGFPCKFLAELGVMDVTVIAATRCPPPRHPLPPGVAQPMRNGAKPRPAATAPPSRNQHPAAQLWERSRAFCAAITTRKITMVRPARAALRVLLDADGEELFGEQIAARAGLALGTI